VETVDLEVVVVMIAVALAILQAQHHLKAIVVEAGFQRLILDQAEVAVQPTQERMGQFLLEVMEVTEQHHLFQV
jgi:hypothetical protein